MMRLAALMLLVVSTAGCGLTETLGAAATDATAKAQELKQAKATQARGQRDLAAAAEVATEQRVDAEKASQ